MKTSELTGQLLNYWAAKALHSLPGHEFRLGLTVDTGIMLRNLETGVDMTWEPSTNWGQGGPIIDRERIGFLPATKDIKADKNYQRRTGRSFMPETDGWVAGYRPITHVEFDWDGAQEVGPTPLIAAMRALVASKYGDDVPDEN